MQIWQPVVCEKSKLNMLRVSQGSRYGHSTLKCSYIGLLILSVVRVLTKPGSRGLKQVADVTDVRGTFDR